MPFRDILLQIDSYPDPTPLGAIDQAVNFAAMLGGDLTGLAVHIDIRVPRHPLAEYLIALSQLEADEESKSLEACRTTLEHLAVKSRQLGVTSSGLVERTNLYLVGEHVAKRARTRDLCIVPVADRRDGQRSVVEAVIFGSARPTIVFQPGVADLPTGKLGTVVLAWDGSRYAARAMVDALPILQMAREVRVLTAVKEKPAAVAGIGVDAVRHLLMHGVNATAEEVESSGQRIGAVLDAYVERVDADLLVMGGYGQSRIREFILGGATEHVLENPKVPLLLSH